MSNTAIQSGQARQMITDNNIPKPIFKVALKPRESDSSNTIILKLIQQKYVISVSNALAKSMNTPTVISFLSTNAVSLSESFNKAKQVDKPDLNTNY